REPAAADRVAGIVAGQHVPAVDVQPVALALLAHALFVDEHRGAQVEQGGALVLARPVGDLDVEVLQLHRRRRAGRSSKWLSLTRASRNALSAATGVRSKASSRSAHSRCASSTEAP